MDVEAILSRAAQLRILVVGDFFLDRYLWVDGALEETSLETGRRAHQVARVTLSPGGAGNVVANLRALGVGRVDMLGVVGDDGDGFALRRLLDDGKADGLLVTGRFTSTYIKPMAGDGIEMERLDVRTRAPLDLTVEGRVVAALQSHMDDPPDGCLIVDQLAEHGLITPRILDAVQALSTRCRTLVDSRTRITSFAGAHLKPNRTEAARALGPAAPEAHARRLADRSGRDAFVTLAEDGIAACAPGQRAIVVPALAIDRPDPVGAGDTAAASLLAALCAGADAEEAARFAVRCCAVTVGKRGTTGTASPDEIRRIRG